MINTRRKTLSSIVVLMLVMSVSACSTIKRTLAGRDGVDYQRNQAIKQLEVPPDLTKPEFDDAFELPAVGVISAVSLKNGTPHPQEATSARNTGDRKARSKLASGDLSSIRSVAGKTVLLVNDTYPRSLILTEIMANKMGFSTISKSPARDVITVKYTGDNVAVDSAGRGFLNKTRYFLSRGLGESADNALINGETYRISISNEQGNAIVRVTSKSGEALPEAKHAKIISLLNSTFNG